MRLKALAGLIAAMAFMLCAAAAAAQPPPAATPVPAAALAPPPQSPGFGPFKTWAAVVVAGDFHAHSGALAETFDNARRELAKAFVKMGFASDHVSQFSGRPDRYPAYKLLPLTGDGLFNELKRQAAAAPDGCLIYFTSHGNGEGILFGGGIMTPQIMAQLVDGACGTRPTVVFISACFSGVFVPALAAPNRMIMTAARNDRSSFGCQEENEFTFFDNCVLSSLPTSRNFVLLSTAIQACVTKKESSMRSGYDAEIGTACSKLAPASLPNPAEAIKACLTDNGALTVMPPSEPQISIGAEIRPELTLLHLDNRPDS